MTRATSRVAFTRIIAVSSILSLAVVTSSSHPIAAAHPNPLAALSACNFHSRAHVATSRKAPPGPHALRGYTMTYCTDFNGTRLPRGWGKFDGIPGGDPSGRFERSHVVVSGGLLRLNTYRDPTHNNQWATGGTCQCGHAQTYGAYFVRSRVNGGGDDEVQLLWPVAHVWPPEVDFNETGNHPNKTAWYVHFHSDNSQIRKTLRINLTQWHTWGVIWNATSLTFTVDGHVWGIVRAPSVIPHEGMTLDIQQQTWCGIAPECPTKPVSMIVDWVAEFTPNRH